MKIKYGQQSIDQNDITHVLETLSSEFLTQGPKCKEFEKCITEYTGAKYCLALNSATSALHLACLSLDIGKDDIVWTTPITFVATANSVLMCGATIDFVDIDPNTFNISPEKLEQKLTIASHQNRLPTAIIVVHLAGCSCDMKKIHTISKKYNIKIIEDASHAIGGTYNNKRIGYCEFSDMTVFSFHPVKIITTAEGGAICTNKPEIYKRIKLLREHGVTRDRNSLERNEEEGWYYEQHTLGYNYRMSELQCALGISQLSKINVFLERRNMIAQKYIKDFENTGIKFQSVSPECVSSYHLMIILLPEIYNRKNIYNILTTSGIGANVHYIPVHLQPYYKKLGFKSGDFPESEKYYSRALTIPLHPSLTEIEIDYIINTTISAMAENK